LPYYEELTAVLMQYYELIFTNNRFFKKRNVIFVFHFLQIMLQRIQTVYLIIVFILVGVLPFIFPLWTNGEGTEIYSMHIPMFTILFGLSVAMTVVAILGYNNRKRQFVINRLNIILNFILVGLFIYRSLNISGEAVDTVSEKGIGMFLPLISILFIVLANRAIKKDEDLVKSVDRLR